MRRIGLIMDLQLNFQSLTIMERTWRISSIFAVLVMNQSTMRIYRWRMSLEVYWSTAAGVQRIVSMREMNSSVGLDFKF